MELVLAVNGNLYVWFIESYWSGSGRKFGLSHSNELYIPSMHPWVRGSPSLAISESSVKNAASIWPWGLPLTDIDPEISRT